jgi:hypothetical protein
LICVIFMSFPPLRTEQFHLRDLRIDRWSFFIGG